MSTNNRCGGTGNFTVVNADGEGMYAVACAGCEDCEPTQPRWTQSKPQPTAAFLRATLELEAILRVWRNGFEFTADKLEQYGRSSQIVWDTVNEIVHVDGVIPQSTVEDET